MSRTVAGELIGRTAELAVLDALLERASAGQGGIVLLTGDPGMGKSRLARTVTERAAACQACWGACRESQGAPPLWPWLQVLRQLGEPGIAPPGAGEDGAAARFRLYARAEQVLRESARQQPVLVVIDDLHRADDASLRLISYLGDALWPAPVALVVTYRDTEVAAGSLAAQVIAGLARGPGRQRCELAGLSQASVRDWLAAAGIDGVDAADLHERTGGNPLFITESIQLISRGEHDVAALRTVADVIAERLAPLPPHCIHALEVAAVLGREFEYPPLAAALQTSPASAVAALDPAVAARLVQPDDARAGLYRFSHTLIRDVVAGQLAPSRRADLHARVFAALHDTGWGQPSDLAHHAVLARPGISDAVAADAASSAAQAADRLLAFADAARWWRTTIELSAPGDQAQTGLRLRLGRSLLQAGQVDQARAEFEQAAAYAAGAGDWLTLAASALAVGDTVAEVAADHSLVALLDQAMAVSSVPDGMRARLMARWAIATYWQPGGQPESRQVSLAAVELAGQAGDTEALGAALIARQFTLRGPDFLTERIEAGQAVLDIAVRQGDPDLRFRALQWLVPDRFQTGALGLVSGYVEQMDAIARARRNPLQAWWVLVYQTLLAIAAGRDEDAGRLAAQVTTVGRRLGLPAADAYRMGQLGRLYWQAGRLAEIEAEITAGTVRFPGLVTLRCMRALADAVAGRRAQARAQAQALAADGFAALPRDSLYLASLAILAEAVVTCQAAELAGPILAELAPYSQRNLIQGVPVGWGCAAWYIARLEWLLGRRSDAVRSAALARRLHRQWGVAGMPDPLAGLESAPPATPLSKRESEVLGLLAAGRANAEMAAALGVSVHTIERHVANIFTKIGVRNRAEATAWAHRGGLVT